MSQQTKGIDVSKWQGAINWAQVKAAGINFAILRIGGGSADGSQCYLDTQFKANVSGALAAGVDIGAYFYSYALSAAAAAKEADYCIAQLVPYRGKLTYPIYFDIEDKSQEGLSVAVRTDMAIAFCDKLEKAGYYSGIYASKYWLESKLEYSRLKRFDVWLAQWASAPTWAGGYGIWQHSSKGTVAGITGPVDLNVAYKDYPAAIRRAGLNGFAKGDTTQYKVQATVTGRSAAEQLAGELRGRGYTVTVT